MWIVYMLLIVLVLLVAVSVYCALCLSGMVDDDVEIKRGKK